MTALKIFIESEQEHPLMEILNNICEVEFYSGEMPDKGLILSNDELCYISSTSQRITFDWPNQWNYHVRKKYSLKKELLAKALGISKSGTSSVWDATCGTGKDSLLMLSYGLKVRAFERQEVVASLLVSAISSSMIDEDLSSVLKERFSFEFGTVLDYVKINSESIDWPDSLYYDPMFTDAGRKKKALSRKEMEIFKEVVGDDEDSADFLESLLKLPIKRIVVKRHPNSPELLKGVTASYKGKSVRYDLYCNPKV